MALFSTKRDAESVKESGGGNSKYINKPGIYDIDVLATFVSQKPGSKSLVIDFFIEYQEQQQPLYGNLRIFNNDGNENKIGAATFNKLLVILDEDEAADPEEATLPIGKDSADKDVAIIPNLTDFSVKMWVAIEYGKYNGSITEKKVIRNFYRAEDGASAEEIVNEAEPGRQYAKDLEYLENSDNKGYVYKDGVTAEEVEKWIADGRPKGTDTAQAPKPSFTKKRFGK